MGNRQDQNELQFYSNHESKLYGKGVVYSSTQRPNCYVFKRIVPLRDEYRVELFKEIENVQNIYLLGLYGFSVGRVCDCDQKYPPRCISQYWEFLGFSLEEYIEYHTRSYTSIPEEEVWGIMKAAVNGYLTFERMNIYYHFSSDKILLNQERRARLSWLHLEARSAHLPYFELHRIFELIWSRQGGQVRKQHVLGQLWKHIQMRRWVLSPQELNSIAALQVKDRLYRSVHAKDKLGIQQYVFVGDDSVGGVHAQQSVYKVLSRVWH